MPQLVFTAVLEIHALGVGGLGIRSAEVYGPLTWSPIISGKGVPFGKTPREKAMLPGSGAARQGISGKRDFGLIGGLHCRSTTRIASSCRTVPARSPGWQER
jgi:hypothetical protein